MKNVKRKTFVSELGEKALIRDVIRATFGGIDKKGGDLWDDCAQVEVKMCGDLLLSTDQVPEDLIAFRYGVIDWKGLGLYLARLNFSDIAASGGEPVGLLLTLGLPGDLAVSAFEELCLGVQEECDRVGARVLGGDISSAAELSLAATAVGIVPRGRAIRRFGARPGDCVFVSRPVGITPAAFRYLLDLGRPAGLAPFEADLFRPLYGNPPMFELARALRLSRLCTSLMDNTDGYSECFHELAEASHAAFVIDAGAFSLPPCVRAVAGASGEDPLELALAAGADFGLVGTVSDPRVIEELRADFPDLCIVGHVEEGTGVFLERDGRREPLPRRGWDYFTDTARTGPGPKPRP